MIRKATLIVVILLLAAGVICYLLAGREGAAPEGPSSAEAVRSDSRDLVDPASSGAPPGIELPAEDRVAAPAAGGVSTLPSTSSRRAAVSDESTSHEPEVRSTPMDGLTSGVDAQEEDAWELGPGRATSVAPAARASRGTSGVDRRPLRAVGAHDAVLSRVASGSPAPGVSGPMMPTTSPMARSSNPEASGKAASERPEGRAATDRLARNDELSPARDASSESRHGAHRDRDMAEESAEAQTARVWLAASATELLVGQIVEVRVLIESGQDVASVPFHLSFDPALLAFRGAVEGPLLSSDGRPTVFMAVPSAAGDRVIVGASRLGQQPGVNGDGELCRLSFEVMGEGRAALRFERTRVVKARGSDQVARLKGLLLELHR